MVFPIKVMINYHTKEFGFIYSLHYLISKDNFILRKEFFLWDNIFVFYLCYKSLFIGVKPQCYFGKFWIDDFYCTVYRIILNIYRCVIYKKYKRQDIKKMLL